MVYANSVAVLFVSFKFFVFGLERKWAMNKRHSYEIYDGSLAKQLVLRTVLLLCMVVVVKIVVLFYRSTASSVDQRLTESFLFECHPLVAFPLTAIAGISLVFGVYEFYRVQHFVKQNRHDARSLTESFLFRETQSVLEVMNPLVFAYFLLASTSALVTGFAISLLHYGDCNVHSSTYRIFINASYLAVSVYGLFASLFMIFKFAAVRRLFYHDFYKLTGRRLLSNRTSVVPYNMDAIQVQSHYFADLNRAWN
ncbi:hypothetical protein M3Y94_00424300 [Aphelenchoides besseyi]|nr:hypothetical protein M3Y94_00424300 [Aphelenchoides besseyi]